jgi:hypothetical protein
MTHGGFCRLVEEIDELLLTVRVHGKCVYERHVRVDSSISVIFMRSFLQDRAPSHPPCN